MIPGRVIEVLRGASVMWVGTRNAELRTANAPVVAAVVHDDAQTITLFVSEAASKRILADAADNGRLAFGAAQATHEAYQLKGAYVSSRPASDEEYAFIETSRDTLWRTLAQHWPEDLVKGMVLKTPCRPSVAIQLRVEEVFLQTPGPGAGTRMEA